MGEGVGEGDGDGVGVGVGLGAATDAVAEGDDVLAAGRPQAASNTSATSKTRAITL